MVRDDQRMPLREHLIELRRTLLRCLGVFIVLFAAGVYMAGPVLDFVLIPWDTTRAALIEAGDMDPGPLIYIGPAEGILFSLKVSFLLSLLGGAPFYLWEFWRFVGVGLTDGERRAVHRALLPSFLLLATGMVFGYRVLLPFGLQYLVTYLPIDMAIAQITVSAYLSFVTALTLLMGLVFQTPLVMAVLTRAGVVQAATLSRSRRMAVLIVMIFAAVATPPDPVTMVLVAAPVLVLYEFGLILARRAERARLRAEQAAFGD